MPYIGVSDSGHAKDRFPTRLLSTPNRHAGEISKEETDLMMMEAEMPSVRSNMVSKIESMLRFNGIPTTVVHHEAMLRVHMENGHKFSPDQNNF